TGTAKKLARDLSGYLTGYLSGYMADNLSGNLLDGGVPADDSTDDFGGDCAGDSTTRELSGQLALERVEELDLLVRPPQHDLNFGSDDLLVLTSPVYSGRMPEPLQARLDKMRGSGTPAIIAMTYGDRAYDDALLELADRLEERGFIVIGAGAFVARHAVFPRYAVGRPDEQDLLQLRALAEQSLARLISACACNSASQTVSSSSATPPLDVSLSGPIAAPQATSITIPSTTGCATPYITPLSTQLPEPLTGPFAALSVRAHIKGKRPYMKPQELPIYPRPDSRCVGCGTCARLCPVQAIDPRNIKAQPDKRCLACAACIHACPQQSRKFRGLLYNGFDLVFLALSKVTKSKRKDPEIFV
ncbi:4Fe-4S binding protein, partial [Desulfovibrio sp. OttesenSCG-928-C06]|nr:4Fe-4S binding protein [Desulfovibrio sp. OttesenSCG-928-C06]